MVGSSGQCRKVRFKMFIHRVPKRENRYPLYIRLIMGFWCTPLNTGVLIIGYQHTHAAFCKRRNMGKCDTGLGTGNKGCHLIQVIQTKCTRRLDNQAINNDNSLETGLFNYKGVLS